MDMPGLSPTPSTPSWWADDVGDMTPSARPCLLFAGMQRRQSGQRCCHCHLRAGYLLGGLGSARGLSQWAPIRSRAFTGEKTASPWLGGATIASGIYRSRRVPRALSSPLGLMSHWRNGTAGACAWESRTAHVSDAKALMCVLFVVGVMNLAWSLLSVFVLVEKMVQRAVRCTYCRRPVRRAS